MSETTERDDCAASGPRSAAQPRGSGLTRALTDVLAERARQDARWGEQNHDPFLYLAILTEEVGELSQAALQSRFEGGDQKRIREEAVQVAAVALAIVECLDRAKWRWPRE